MDQAQQLRLRYLSDRYDTHRTAWLKRVQKWEMRVSRETYIKEVKTFSFQPTTVARREKYIEIFERTFPELRKQREEKQRSDRVEVRTTTSISGTETRQACSEADELRKLHQQAVIPPTLYDERMQNRFKFINRNGLVRDCWTYDRKEFFFRCSIPTTSIYKGRRSASCVGAIRSSRFLGTKFNSTARISAQLPCSSSAKLPRNA